MEVSYDHESKLIHPFVHEFLEKHPYKCTKLVQVSSISSITNVFGGMMSLMARSSVLPIDKILPSTHEAYKTADGATVCCTFYHPNVVDSKTPLLFILNTFGGNTPLFEALIIVLIKNLGWNVVLYHRRGVHCPLTSFSEHVSGNDDDLKLTLEAVYKKYPSQPFFCLGYSAGGSILARCLGKYNFPFIIAAATISSALHEKMFTAINPLLGREMLKASRKRFKDYEKKHPLDKKERDIYNRLQNSGGNLKQYGEIESELFAKSVDEFYSKQAVEKWIGKVQIPLISINAKDDKVCAHPELHKDLLLKIPNSIYVITEYGGHCVFDSNTPYLTNVNWAEFVIISFFQYLLVEKSS